MVSNQLTIVDSSKDLFYNYIIVNVLFVKSVRVTDHSSLDLGLVDKLSGAISLLDVLFSSFIR
jgi:hypothetical protein